MKISFWKKGLKMHIPALETVLENIFHASCSIEVQETALDSADDTAKKLQEPKFLTRFSEDTFETEILLGFNKHWGSRLSHQILAEEAADDDVEEELVAEFSRVLLDLITISLEEIGVDTGVNYQGQISAKNLKEESSAEEYFVTHLQATTSAGDEEKEELPALDLWIAVAQPDEKQVESYEKKFNEKNPFEDETYTQALAHLAGETHLKRSSNQENEASEGIKLEGQSVEFEDFGHSGTHSQNREVRNIDILKDVKMDVSVELGRREMPLGNILQLVKGSVIELEKLAGEPVEILVNGHPIAQGDVVVIDEHFGVRISNLLASQERIKELQ